MGLCPRPQRPKAMKTRKLILKKSLFDNNTINICSTPDDARVSLKFDVSDEGYVNHETYSAVYYPMIIFSTYMVFFVFEGKSNLKQLLNNCCKETI